MYGYVFENENGWTYGVFDLMLSRKRDCHAKRAFVHFLREGYTGDLDAVNAAVGSSAKSFDELADTPSRSGSPTAA